MCLENQSTGAICIVKQKSRKTMTITEGISSTIKIIETNKKSAIKFINKV